MTDTYESRKQRAQKFKMQNKHLFTVCKEQLSKVFEFCKVNQEISDEIETLYRTQPAENAELIEKTETYNKLMDWLAMIQREK